MQQQQRDDLIKDHAKIIIPALLFNMQDGFEDNLTINSDVMSGDSNDDESPRGLADQECVQHLGAF